MYGPFDTTEDADLFTEQVAMLAFEIVPRLRVPGAHALPVASVEDVRADAVAATWRAAHRRPEGFADPDGHPDEGAVAGYLQAALRKSIDELARRGRERETVTLISREPDREERDPASIVVAAERQDRLDRAIAELPRGLREVVMRRQAGWSYARIAGELGLRENTGIQRYRRAIGRLPLELRAGLPPSNYRGR